MLLKNKKALNLTISTKRAIRQRCQPDCDDNRRIFEAMTSS
jgi:hypothetical protein